MNVTVVCDRCRKTVEGMRGPRYTAGFYDAEAWVKYTNPGEKIICDNCMWSDARYQADYGKTNAAARSEP